MRHISWHRTMPAIMSFMWHPPTDKMNAPNSTSSRTHRLASMLCRHTLGREWSRAFMQSAGDGSNSGPQWLEWKHSACIVLHAASGYAGGSPRRQSDPCAPPQLHDVDPSVASSSTHAHVTAGRSPSPRCSPLPQSAFSVVPLAMRQSTAFLRVPLATARCLLVACM